MSPHDEFTVEPAADYDSLRKQFLALRTLANSKARQVIHWRNQCGTETHAALLTNAANVNAERDTNQILTDALLAAEAERDRLHKALSDVRGAVQREYWDEYAGLDETRAILDAAIGKEVANG